MKQLLTWCLMLLAVGTISAQTTTPKPRPRAKAASAVTSADVQALRDALAAQQQQIATQQQQMRELKQQLQQVQQQLQQAQNRAEDASSAAGQTDGVVAALRGDVSAMKANSTASSVSFQQEQKRITELEHPTAIRFKGITITPGGFIEAAGVVRSRNENASVNSASGDFGIPLSGSPNAHLSEFRFDARQSRLTLLGEGKIGSTRVSGYYEVDFLGAAPTANENQSNSFNLRQRQLWASAAFSNGLTFTGGQQWSLLTLTRKGMENRNEFLPMTINAQYVIGYDWARQPGLRVMKNINNKVWAGIALENPSTVLNVSGLSPTGNPPISGFNSSPNAQSPNGNFTLSNTPGANGVSTNLAPDLVAKVTFEPGWGHYELKAVGRFFRDRYKGNTDTAFAGGVGAGVILPLVASKVDLIAEGLFGNGVGRYGSGGGFDVTLRPDGTIVPVRSYHALLGPEIHVGKKLDLYGYAGGEYYQRTFYLTSATTSVGYGSPLLVNSGCTVEQTTATAPPACGNNTRAAWEFAPGFWYRFYKGPAGTVQWGLQYSYSARGLWRGTGGTPDGSENQVYTSFRYYIP